MAEIFWIIPSWPAGKQDVGQHDGSRSWENGCHNSRSSSSGGLVDWVYSPWLASTIAYIPCHVYCEKFGVNSVFCSFSCRNEKQKSTWSFELPGDDLFVPRSVLFSSAAFSFKLKSPKWPLPSQIFHHMLGRISAKSEWINDLHFGSIFSAGPVEDFPLHSKLE